MTLTFEEVHSELRKFIVWLANKNVDSHGDADLMNVDDIKGELYVELWKGYKRYSDLPKGQLLAVIRRMMDNRISELRYRFFVTHRKEELNNISISDIEDDAQSLNYAEKFIDVKAINPLNITISKEYINDVRGRLSESAIRVFDAVIYGNDRMSIVIELSATRNAYVYKNGGTLKIRPHHVADALCMNIKDVELGWSEIKTMCNIRRSPRILLVDRSPRRST